MICFVWKCETQNRWSLVATLTVYKEARFVCVFMFWCVESEPNFLEFRNCASNPLCVWERERESNTSTTPPKGVTPKYTTITDDLLITFRRNHWKVGGSWLMTLLMLWSSNLLMHTNSCFATPADMVVCVLKDWGTYLMDKHLGGFSEHTHFLLLIRKKGHLIAHLEKCKKKKSSSSNKPFKRFVV
jgi:hypothetical protein